MSECNHELISIGGDEFRCGLCNELYFYEHVVDVFNSSLEQLETLQEKLTKSEQELAASNDMVSALKAAAMKNESDVQFSVGFALRKLKEIDKLPPVCKPHHVLETKLIDLQYSLEKINKQD